MEEIITVDGRQFKLTTDRPLTEEQKAQTLAEIRKQTGCGTCGTRVAKAGNDWQYGGVRSLVPTYDGTPGTPPAGTKGSGSTVDLSVEPTGGVGPYKAWFYIHHNAGDAGTIITVGRLAVPAGPYADPVGIVGSQPYTNIPEGGGVFRRIYTLNDLDVSSATNDATATLPTDVNATNGALTFGGVIAAKGAATIRFYTAITDSCTGTTGPAGCVQWADVALVCIAPTCNFVVT